MELGTFGAVLRFALELEAAATTFYKSAADRSVNQKTKQLAERLVQQGDKRVQLLMRLRRENTTEMLLEPIKGLDSARFRPQTDDVKATVNSSFAKLATAMEEKVRSFYTAAAEKTSFLSEVASAFERLAEEHGQNAHELQSLSGRPG